MQINPNFIKGNLFLIQLLEVKADTMFFDCIQVYSPKPKFEYSEDSTFKFSGVPLSKFNKGVYSKSKKMTCNKIYLIYSPILNVDSVDIIENIILMNPQEINLSDWYKIGLPED